MKADALTKHTLEKAGKIFSKTFGGRGEGPDLKSLEKRFKALTCRAVFFVLGRAFQSGSRHDPDIRREIAAWPDGFTVVLNVAPAGPSMGLRKTKKRLKRVGGEVHDGDLAIDFKNLECAHMVLTPRIGAARAFAERRMAVKGDLADALIFTRCLNILIAYLYPKAISGKLLKRVPRMTLKKQLVRATIFGAGIPFGL